MLRNITIGIIAGTVLTATVLANEDDSKKDAEQLQGTWQATTVERAGVKQENPESMTFTFKKDRYTLKMGEQVLAEGTFKLDPSTTPKSIDLTITEGKDKGKVFLGVYSVGKDGLKWCAGDPGDKNRPKSLASQEGKAQSSGTFKKQAP